VCGLYEDVRHGKVILKNYCTTSARNFCPHSLRRL